MKMRIEVVVGAHEGSQKAYCGEGRGGRVFCARGKGWYGSGGDHKLAHSRESDQAIACSTARAARTDLRLRLRGDHEWNAVYVGKW